MLRSELLVCFCVEVAVVRLWNYQAYDLVLQWQGWKGRASHLSEGSKLGLHLCRRRGLRNCLQEYESEEVGRGLWNSGRAGLGILEFVRGVIVWIIKLWNGIKKKWLWNHQNPCLLNYWWMMGMSKRWGQKGKYGKVDVECWMGRIGNSSGIQLGGSSWVKKLVALRTEISGMWLFDVLFICVV